jgi:putative hemolysin
MLRQGIGGEEAAGARLTVGLAATASDVEDAQRLRHAVFAEEMGARLQCRRPGLDEDGFDPYCDHLLVRDRATGEAVGTYRILPPERAAAAGGYYTEQEFDLSRLAHLRACMAELGRSCIHPEYRTGPAIALLWAALARYMVRGGHRYLIGCASIGMADGGHAAAHLYLRLSRTHLAPPEYRTFARCPLPVAELAGGAPDGPRAEMPPLVKGYLRMGAYVCGEPAWDPDFNSADLPILLPIARVSGRHARHYLGDAAAAAVSEAA